MYNAAEYIMSRRAIAIVESGLKNGITYRTTSGHQETLSEENYYISYEPEEALRIQQNLEFLFTLVFPGTRFKRFVGIRSERMNKPIAITLVEIYEPTHSWLPLLITSDSVLIVSPFGGYDIEEISENRWFYEIIPTSLLADKDLDAVSIEDFSTRPIYNNEDGSAILVRDYFKDLILSFVESNQHFDEVIYDEYYDVGAESLLEVEVGDNIWKNMSNKFSTESILKIDEDHEKEIISPTDYIPIVLKRDDAYNRIIVKVHEQGKLNVVGVTSELRLNELTNTYNSTYVIVKVPKLNTYIIHIESGYYVGKNKVMFSWLNEFNTVDLLEITSTPEEVSEEISTEGFMSTTKDLLNAVKIFGLRKGSTMYAAVMGITKIPRRFAKDAFNALKRAFQIRVEVEKAETLDLQEKLLNDEMDSFIEKVRLIGVIGIKAAAWTAVLGNILFLPVFIILRRRSERKTKLGSVERLEFKLDGMIERVEYKLEAAKAEGDHKAVDQLLAEKHHLEFSRLKLIEHKRDLTGKDRIRYMTFNKDDSMNSRQRIDALMKSGGYFNIGNSYGNSYTVGSTVGGGY